MCVVCHPTRLPFRSAFSPPPPVGLPPDCCLVVIRRSAVVRIVCPFLLPAAGSFPARCTPEHSSSLFRKKELLLLRVRPGQVKARLRPIGGNGPSAAMVLRRLRLFGGCGPAVIALRSAPCIFSFGRGRSVTAGRECRMLSRERGCVRPHDRFCAAGAKKEVRCLPASSLSG